MGRPSSQQAWKHLRVYLLSALALAAAFLLLNLVGIGCPIKFLTGISCPGCGMTRAWISIFKLDLAAAFRYHPMFWSVPILCALYLFDGRIFKHTWLNYAVTIGILAGFFACWIVRLVMGWQV